MPFTLSHAVVAPPIAHLSRNFLPIAAVAIGSMLPDFYRLFTTQEGGFSHSWPAILHPNFMIGLGFCLLWYWLYRPVLYQLFDLEDPLPILSIGDAIKFSLGCSIGLVLGNALHILWDGLTHLDSRTWILHDFLAQSVQLFGHEVVLHVILQLSCSAISLPILAWMMWRYRKQHHMEYAHSLYLKLTISLILVLSMIAGLFYSSQNLRYFYEATEYHFAYYFIGRAFNEFSQGFLVCSCLGFCLLLIWQKLFDSDSI